MKKTSGSTGQPTPILFNFFQKSAIAGHANYLRKKHNFRIREGYALIWGHSTNLKPIKQKKVFNYKVIDFFANREI